MRALGVALAACCTMVLWPSAAHANPIGAHTGVVTCALGVQHFDALDADEATFTRQTGIDHSIHFANTGTVSVFDDERIGLGDAIDLDGLGLKTHKDQTLALRTPHHGDDGDHDSDPANDRDGNPPHAGGPVPVLPTLKVTASTVTEPEGGGIQTSATPEPGSIVLLATGLAAVIWWRRQIFA